MNPEALAAAAARDVIVLHQVFEAWLSGRAPRGVEAFRPIEEALGPGFAMVVPDGTLVDRAAVIERLARSHGARGAGLRILVEDVVPVLASAEAAAIRYVERQSCAGGANARRATAVIVPAATPSGIAWRFVQETWCG